jgi:tetratricopeptide (TPR) repeat protein
MGIFWVTAFVSLWSGRRNVLFSVLTLLGIGYLSRTAQRHEILFIITGLTLTIYQLRYSAQWNAFLEYLQTKRALFPIVSIVAIFCIGFYTHVRAYDINRNDNLYGFGVFEPLRGASEYIHSEHLSGNMFNNYNAGGELLFRDHSVFLDGRNLDYGYDYMLRAINAGVDPDTWNGLEKEYNFTHAVIYYNLQAQMDPLPYTDLLDADPQWKLVYLDDWAAVYRKISEGRAISTVTPKSLENQDIPPEMHQQYFQKMQSELNDMIRVRPDAVKARIYLAKLYTAIQAYSEAEVLLNDALSVQPNNFKIYLGLMKLRMEQGRWDDALVYVKKAKRKAGFSGLSINEDVINQIRSRAKSDI